MESEPLFPPGYHQINIEDLKTIFVDRFQNNARREMLLERLVVFMGLLESVGIRIEVWIDGSFSTVKEEPSDIDICFVPSASDVNGLPEDKKRILASIIQHHDDIKLRYNCDVYYAEKENFHALSYYRGIFSFDRDERPKGIPRIFIG